MLVLWRFMMLPPPLSHGPRAHFIAVVVLVVFLVCSEWMVDLMPYGCVLFQSNSHLNGLPNGIWMKRRSARARSIDISNVNVLATYSFSLRFHFLHSWNIIENCWAKNNVKVEFLSDDRKSVKIIRHRNSRKKMCALSRPTQSDIPGVVRVFISSRKIWQSEATVGRPRRLRIMNCETSV